ncbi:MAG: hypothetical protein EPO32_07590 [Anaerolineae bacterium]|nr:MAG: hypothetical protein EPO32_07590 [Anaerolineae bacterium]
MADSAAAPRTPWLVRVLALLLLAQSVGLALLARSNLHLGLSPQITDLSELSLRLLPPLAYGLAALIALLAAPSFWRRRPNAWHFALLAQGLMLAIALVLYFNSRPPYTYVMMVFGLYMVLSLHNEEVRLIFHALPASRHPAQPE